jgi:serine/threonine protein kinase
MREPAASQIIAGKYRIESLIGHGGMGSVWRARHVSLDMPVAIKFMSAHSTGDFESRQRFEREARALATLRTPHIVQVLDHGVDGEVPYIVMEYLEGEDLSTRLGLRKRLTLEQTSRILAQVARGLRRAHEAGITHRDLKPSNIFLARIDEEEVVKVLDFGVAKLDPTGLLDEGQLTKAGTLLGSPGYMSPEQARGKEVDFRSDLWALAVIVFRAVTGTKPFMGDSIAELVIKLCIEPRPVASRISPELPPAIDKFFERAFAQSPEDRFDSAVDMAITFAALVGQPASETSHSGPSPVRAIAPASLDAPASAAASLAAAGSASKSILATAQHPTEILPPTNLGQTSPRPHSAPAPSPPISTTPPATRGPGLPPGFPRSFDPPPAGIRIPPPPSAASLREPTPTPASFTGFAPSGNEAASGPPAMGLPVAPFPEGALRASPVGVSPHEQTPRPSGPEAPDTPTPTGMRLHLPGPTLIMPAPPAPRPAPRWSPPAWLAQIQIPPFDPKLVAVAVVGVAVLVIFFALAIAGLKRRHTTATAEHPEGDVAPLTAPSLSALPSAAPPDPVPSVSASAAPSAPEPAAPADPAPSASPTAGAEPSAEPSSEPAVVVVEAPVPQASATAAPRPTATAHPSGATNPTAQPTGKISPAPSGSTKKKGPKPNFGY